MVLAGSLGNSGAGQRESGRLQQSEQQPHQRNEPDDTISQSEQFLLKTENVNFADVDSNDLGASRFEPAVGCGARNTSLECVSNVAGRSDEFTEAMVISALNTSRSNHDSIIVTAPYRSNRNDENSYKKVQVVVTDSCALCIGHTLCEETKAEAIRDATLVL